MKNTIRAPAVLIAAASTAACTHTDQRTVGGATLGGASGALIGGAVGGTEGALLGGGIGILGGAAVGAHY